MAIVKLLLDKGADADLQGELQFDSTKLPLKSLKGAHI
jgi:hypothetical protein